MPTPRRPVRPARFPALAAAQRPPRAPAASPTTTSTSPRAAATASSCSTTRATPPVPSTTLSVRASATLAASPVPRAPIRMRPALPAPRDLFCLAQNASRSVPMAMSTRPPGPTAFPVPPRVLPALVLRPRAPPVHQGSRSTTRSASLLASHTPLEQSSSIRLVHRVAPTVPPAPACRATARPAAVATFSQSTRVSIRAPRGPSPTV